MRFDHIKEWRNKCTGCSACISVCPKGAVHMITAAGGFEYPSVDETICIQCGLCEKVCSIGKKLKKTQNKAVYASRAADEKVRSMGSSGGVFEIAARNIVDSGGSVYGAVFDPESKNVMHVSNCDKGIEPLLRSKYVQSKMRTTYREVGERLERGDTVLFSGTPCQIRGLYGYLNAKGIYGDLTTMDFFCHGVPSPGIFKEYIEALEREHGSNVVNVTFREKEKGWRQQTTRVYFSNGNILSFDSEKHFYYYMFLNNYILRDSCYGCQEYCSHMADITMADYWDVAAEKDDDQGMSLVLLNTEKGIKLWARIANEVVSEPLSPQSFNYKPYSHENYDYHRKRKCMAVYRRSGIHGLRKRFFVKQYILDHCNRKVRHIGGSCKRMLKAVILKR